jgi:DNA repair exonuclease SbcCD ATPase subunit
MVATLALAGAPVAVLLTQSPYLFAGVQADRRGSEVEQSLRSTKLSLDKAQEDLANYTGQNREEVTKVLKSVQSALLSQEESERRLSGFKEFADQIEDEKEKIKKEKATLQKETSELRKEKAKLQQETSALLKDKAELQTETSDLQKEKAALEKEKIDLEWREGFFSKGFFASLVAALAAIIGLIAKVPATRLQKELLRLEIREKQLAIENQR